MIAHIIITSASLALLVAWGAAALGVLAGAVLLIADLHHRRLGALILIASSAGATTAALLTPWPPAPPGYSISVRAPHSGARVTNPVAIMICGRFGDGSAADVPGGDRLVYVALDGKQVMLSRGASMVVSATSGQHVLRLEVLASDHRAFTPPLLVDVPIIVAGVAPPTLQTSCAP